MHQVARVCLSTNPPRFPGSRPCHSAVCAVTSVLRLMPVVVYTHSNCNALLAASNCGQTKFSRSCMHTPCTGGGRAITVLSARIPSNWIAWLTGGLSHRDRVQPAKSARMHFPDDVLRCIFANLGVSDGCVIQ